MKIKKAYDNKDIKKKELTTLIKQTYQDVPWAHFPFLESAHLPKNIENRKFNKLWNTM